MQTATDRSQVSKVSSTISEPVLPESTHYQLDIVEHTSSKINDTFFTSNGSQPKKLTFRISKMCVTIVSSREAILASASDLWSLLEVVIPLYRPTEIDENYLLEFFNECMDTCSQETWLQDAKEWSKDFVDNDDLPTKFLKISTVMGDYLYL